MTKSITEYAEEYLARGFGICRLLPGEKVPSYKQWNLASLTPDNFADDDNIGILCGRLSGDLVCVDLDGDEALQLADKYLPPTDMVDGRPSRPRSHRWYRVTDIPPEMVSKKASGGIGGPWLKHLKHAETGKNILDFIGTGGQAAVPPSLHPSGERRVWDSEGEPACLPMAVLWEAVLRLAEACGYKPDAEPEVQPRKKVVSSRPPKQEGGWKPRLAPNQELRPLDERVKQGERFVNCAEPARSGHGGHDTTFRVARYLRNDLALPYEEGFGLLKLYNERLREAGEETWNETELDHKWETASPSHAHHVPAAFPAVEHGTSP
jgi:hypothetical protein